MRGESAALFCGWIWRITNMDGCVGIVLGFDTKDG